MSANPRKFSEKIALQQQKQAEGTAAYEQIMREVLATTRLAIVKPMQPKQELQNHPNGFNPLKESDPGNSINLKNALMNLEDIKHSIEKPQASYTPNMVNVMGGHSREQSPMRHLHPQQHSKRKKFSADRHREFSPYATPHLLALDPGWRRVSSDSAIHATVQSGNDANSRVATSDAKNQGSPINQNTALLFERNLRPRSCEMAGVSMNGYPPTVPIQIPPFNNPSYLSIPPQTNHSSGSLPNIKCSAQQMSSPASNHSTTNYVEGSGQPMMGQPFTYMAVRSMDGGNLVMQGSGGGAIYLGHHQPGSYVQSPYGNSQMGSVVSGMPSQNGHFVLQHPNIMTPQTLPTNQVIGYSEVAPPPYPYPKSSSLPPTSPPPSITLTDVECQGRALETILMESPALNLTEDMYSPSWERFLQSPGLKSPNMVYATPHHLSHQIANPPPQSSGYLMSGGSPSPVMQMVQSGGNYQSPMTCANTNQWTGSINNNNIHNINHNNNNNNNKAVVQPQNVSITSCNNNNNNINLSPFFRNSGVQILAKNDPPPPPYESLSAAQSQTNNPGQTLIDDLFLPNRRNPLLRQDAQSSVLLPGDLEDFPSLSCLGDSFEDVELMNAEDLLKLEPLEIEDLNLLSSSTCTVSNEEFFALDKNC